MVTDRQAVITTTAIDFITTNTVFLEFTTIITESTTVITEPTTITDCTIITNSTSNTTTSTATSYIVVPTSVGKYDATAGKCYNMGALFGSAGATFDSYMSSTTGVTTADKCYRYCANSSNLPKDAAGNAKEFHFVSQNERSLTLSDDVAGGAA